MSIVPYTRFGSSFFDLSLPLRAPHRAENRFKAATLVMHNNTGRISVKEASTDFQDYTSDLYEIAEVIRSLLPKDPILQKESLSLICSGLARIGEVNALIKKHNNAIEKSTWLTIVSVILLVLTFGIFHYKKSLGIDLLNPSNLQQKFISLSENLELEEELTLGKIRDLPQDLRKSLLEKLSITEALLQDTELECEPFFIALTELPFTKHTKKLLETPLSKILADKTELLAALTLKKELKQLPSSQLFPEGIGKSPLYESAHMLLESMRHEEGALEKSSLSLYQLPGKKITPDLAAQFSCCAFSPKEVAQIDFSAWKEASIKAFFCKDEPAKVAPYLSLIPLDKLDSLLNNVDPISLFAPLFPLLSPTHYSQILEKGKRELRDIPFLELRPYDREGELDLTKLSTIALLYEELGISFAYFPSVLENGREIEPAFTKCDFEKIPPVTRPLLLGGEKEKMILTKGKQEKKFSLIQEEFLLVYLRIEVRSPF